MTLLSVYVRCTKGFILSENFSLLSCRSCLTPRNLSTHGAPFALSTNDCLAGSDVRSASFASAAGNRATCSPTVLGQPKGAAGCAVSVAARRGTPRATARPSRRGSPSPRASYAARRGTWRATALEIRTVFIPTAAAAGSVAPPTIWRPTVRSLCERRKRRRPARAWTTMRASREISRSRRRRRRGRRRRSCTRRMQLELWRRRKKRRRSWSRDCRLFLFVGKVRLTLGNFQFGKLSKECSYFYQEKNLYFANFYKSPLVSIEIELSQRFLKETNM